MADGVLYLCGESTVTALQRRDAGHKRWDGPSGLSPQRPAFAHGTLYVGDLGDDEGLWALGKDGKKKWVFPVGYSIPQTPVVSGGLVYALDAEDGSERWSASTWTGRQKVSVVALGAATGATPDGSRRRRLGLDRGCVFHGGRVRVNAYWWQ
ncbi:hypothetical protein GCM10009801_19180 [Streptomyces albiaxialis]|uniref:Pyrrolo-quinoline quinone repeat domain-containing protein n=1 Tax=Streptomyces albiaxialis TaxID=329523 RepID=A0ABN2VRC0_9ACTN